MVEFGGIGETHSPIIAHFHQAGACHQWLSGRAAACPELDEGSCCLSRRRSRGFFGALFAGKPVLAAIEHAYLQKQQYILSPGLLPTDWEHTNASHATYVARFLMSIRHPPPVHNR